MNLRPAGPARIRKRGIASRAAVGIAQVLVATPTAKATGAVAGPSALGAATGAASTVARRPGGGAKCLCLLEPGLPPFLSWATL
eukprot:scaffold1021_cov108-Isochrysis_galbana.AAC.13